MKRTICILLSALLILTANVSAFASENKCGENQTYAFSDDGKLTISGSGSFYSNAKEILTAAENERHGKSVNEISEKYSSREKTLQGKIASIIVDGYYQGTDREYELEIATLSKDTTDLRTLIDNETDETVLAQYQSELKEKEKEYNRLVILKSNKQHLDVLQAELDSLPSEKEKSLSAEDKLHNENLNYITEALKPKQNTPSQTKITVPTPSLKKPKAIKKGFKLKWIGVNGASGYIIQYSTSKKFTKKKTKTIYIKNAKAASKKVKKLKSKKKYYIRIRAYKTVSKKNYYSSWSKTKTVKTK